MQSEIKQSRTWWTSSSRKDLEGEHLSLPLCATEVMTAVCSPWVNHSPQQRAQGNESILFFYGLTSQNSSLLPTKGERRTHTLNYFSTSWWSWNPYGSLFPPSSSQPSRMASQKCKVSFLKYPLILIQFPFLWGNHYFLKAILLLSYFLFITPDYRKMGKKQIPQGKSSHFYNIKDITRWGWK